MHRFPVNLISSHYIPFFPSHLVCLNNYREGGEEGEGGIQMLMSSENIPTLGPLLLKHSTKKVLFAAKQHGNNIMVK